MRIRALMYHDVVEAGRDAASGFPGADALLYKLDVEQFRAHLAELAAVVACPPVLATTFAGESNGKPWSITFDDGGASAITHTAFMLEELGWRGHFFVTTDYIGSSAFMTRAQIKELRARGHIVGSHSASHPMRMSHCTSAEMLHEWRESRDILSNILGERVDTASVPGGSYSTRVAAAAAEAGYKVLFTSEPVTRSRQVSGCCVLGRYSIQRKTPASTAAALATFRLAPGLRQALIWNTKKVAKGLCGQQYLRIRKSILDRKASKLEEGEVK